MHVLSTQKENNAFTLIELLVVIAIIGLLATVVMVSLNSARKKSRDTRRIHDLEQLNRAILMYANDHGQLPCLSIGSGGYDTYIDDQAHCLATALVPDYIAVIPTDPKYGGDGNTVWGQDYQYFLDSDNNGTEYALRVMLETDTLKRTHTYPSGYCQSAGYPLCKWTGAQKCVYATGGNCDRLWYHVGGEI